MGIIEFFRRKKPVTKIRSAAYIGASKDRLFADFVASIGSADSILNDSLETLRARSRDFERNNEYFGWYLNLMKSNVVGSEGITLQVKARNPDGSIDKAGNEMVEVAWKKFGRWGSPTVDGQWSMIDVLNHVASAVPRDGEVIARKIVSKNVPGGIALQFIEPDLLDEKLNQDSRNGNPIRMGVELNAITRRPVAYWMLRNHPGDNGYTTYSGSKHIRVPADEIIHVFRRDRVGQTRGVPWGANVIRSLKMLHGYREAELVAARLGASKMGFFTSKSGDSFIGDSVEAGDDGRPGTGSPVMNAEPGTFHQLPEDMDFTSWDPNHPNTGFGDFEKAILRGVASGLGVNYSALSNDFEGISYSSIRHGALSERDFYKTIQRFVIDHFLDPVFRWWLDYAMDFGLLPFSGEVKFRKFADAATWKPRGFAWVDPEKEMRANVIALQNGLTSHSDIVATQGKDTEELFAQIQRDMDAAERYGLSMNYLPFGDVKKAPESSKDEEDEQED